MPDMPQIPGLELYKNDCLIRSCVTVIISGKREKTNNKPTIPLNKIRCFHVLTKNTSGTRKRTAGSLYAKAIAKKNSRQPYFIRMLQNIPT